MVTELKRINYDGTINKKGRWYIWKEICDRCGKIIDDHEIMHLNPDKKEYNNSKPDFCNDCYRYLFDNDIPFEEAKKMYWKGNKNDEK